MKNFIATCWRVRPIVTLIAFIVPLIRAYAQEIANGGFAVPANVACRYIRNPSCVPSWELTHGWQVEADHDYANKYSNRFLLLGQAGLTGPNDERIIRCGTYTDLSLIAGQAYELRFLAKSTSSKGVPRTLKVSLTDDLVPTPYSNYNTPAGQTLFFTPPTPTHETILFQQGVTLNVQPGAVPSTMTEYIVPFTAPLGWNKTQLWLSSIQAPSDSDENNASISVDSVRITAKCATPDIYYQNASYLPPQTRTRGQIIAGNSVTSGATGPVTLQYPNYAEFISVGQISLLPGFSVQGPRNDGATIFSAVVVPCASPQTPCDCLSMDYSRASTALAVTSETVPESSSSYLFPNPSAGRFEFRPGKTGMQNTGYFVVYDIAGREVRSIDCRKAAWHGEGVSIDVSSLEDGLYQYRFVSGTYSTSGRLAIKK